MIIRKAIEKDITDIVGFQQKMAQETEGITLDEFLVSRGVEHVFKDPSRGFYLVVENQDTLIASMLLTPEWSDWRNALFLWIQSLYVIPEFRKKGIFRKMYDHVKEMVENTDEYAGLKLYVDEDNKPAQKAYLQVGMKASHYHLFEWNKLNY